MNSELMWSNKSDDWATPRDFFEKLNNEFRFDYDPCPLLSEQKTAILKEWKGRVFVNPPYSNIRPFLEKGIAEVRSGRAELCVFLVPARTDTRWFHDLVYKKSGMEVRLLKGRLKFGNSPNAAPFPSMLIIYALGRGQE